MRHWRTFLDRVREDLSTVDLAGPFDKEHELTKAIALRVRSVFAKENGIPYDSLQLHHHVVYRNGDVEEDHKAWHAAQRDKWIALYGLNFVPDVMIRTLDDSPQILPIEVKLVRDEAWSSDLSKAIGQSLIYSLAYRQSIAFIGVQRSLKVNLAGQPDDKRLTSALEGLGISLILREVGT